MKTSKPATTVANPASYVRFVTFFVACLTLLSAAFYSPLHAYPNYDHHSDILPSIQEELSATYLFSNPVSSGNHAHQLVITETSGFQDCTGEVIVAGDLLSLTFVLDNPQGNALPGNATIAHVQVLDALGQVEESLVVKTDGGGVMIIMVDM